MRLPKINRVNYVAPFQSVIHAAFAETSQSLWVLVITAFGSGVGVSNVVAVNRAAGIFPAREVFASGFKYRRISHYISERVRVERGPWVREFRNFRFFK